MNRRDGDGFQPREHADISKDDGLTGEELARLARVLRDGTGIVLKDNKQLLAETRLRHRARELGLPSLRHYCDHLWSDNAEGAEREHLIDALTTHQTSFFREAHHFEFLSSVVLPAIGRRQITAWCAGCSTGEEAWTLAMVLADHRERARFPDFEILATDVSAESLRQAASAVYEERSIQDIQEDFRRKYLLRSRDRRRALVKIAPELRGHVQFTQANLVAAQPEITPSADVIFCRNVMIYFDKPTQRLLLNRLVQALAPGGYLFLGHAEAIMGRTWPLSPAGPTTYRKQIA
jgi:chemotaxis protein methyltransferase CheR